MNAEYQVLFFTHTGAIKFDKAMKKGNIHCELMPVPRSLSSNCGVSARIIFSGQVDRLINDQIEEIFLSNDGKYDLIYSAEVN